ncbi:hypothetical protein F4804DRAFT_179325 [Jackrogersella minutella]|nr:hypothetical protein F4804DRAFT_179325 [Jackrogersella minutella]
MVGLRDRFGKYTTPSYPGANAPDMGFFADPTVSLPIGERHGMIDDLGGNRNSLRKRFIQSLSRKKSFPSWQPIDYSTVHDKSQEQRPSLIRKSISSFSSSLRDRFSLDASTEDEDQNGRHSVIRKSFGSMSSSLRGLRTSMGSRPSTDEEPLSAKIPYCDFSRTIGSVGISSRQNYRDFRRGHLSDASSGGDSVPRLPGLDEMIAKARAEKASIDDQSPNSLFSMSIFDGLDHPTTADCHGKGVVEHHEPAARQPGPIQGRLPIRIKRNDLTTSKRTTKAKAIQNSRPRNISDSGYSGCSSPTKDGVESVFETWRVPVQWRDTILETSILMRSEVHVPAPSFETEEEEAQRLSKRVHVIVPDESDHSKPWPKQVYADLRAAVEDVCDRFKPFYAPFAAYTSSNRTVQLFPPDFKLPGDFGFIPGSTMFTLQEALDNWESTIFARSLSEGADEAERSEDSIVTEITWGTSEKTTESDRTQANSPLHVYDLDSSDMDLDLDENFTDSSTLAPEPFILDENDILRQPDEFMQDSLMSWADTSFSSDDIDDDDMTIATRMGFIP